ncbi:MAG: hypothetical protein WBW85_21260, partial [Terriglobales bacterium]
DSTGALLISAEAAGGPAQTVATEVAEQNQVGGANLTGANITAITFGGSTTNPTVTVSVQTALPTFFARIWGRTQVTVGASATAEAYNPTYIAGSSTTPQPPVAPMCVKPWLLPNIDPNNPPHSIFNPDGSITDQNLLGWSSVGTSTQLSPACTTNCNMVPLPTPATWTYYPGDPNTTFPPPTQALPSCTPALTTPYEESIASCVQSAIACNSTANIDTSSYRRRNRETAEGVNCLTHATTGGGDTVTSNNPPTAPFEFVAGADNPVPGASGNNVMVSDSLVTVPVFNSTATAPTNPVQIIGFVQLFLNPDGQPTATNGGNAGRVNATVINLVGCAGTSTTATPILGNGSSAVAVRLISQ